MRFVRTLACKEEKTTATKYAKEDRVKAAAETAAKDEETHS